MTTWITAVHLTALYETTSSYYAWLQFHANNTPTMQIAVMHRSVGGNSSYYFAGDAQSQDLRVQNGETLTISAFDADGALIADAHVEVCLELIEELGALLIPCSLHRIIFDQCEGALSNRALQRAITEALETVDEMMGGQVL